MQSHAVKWASFFSSIMRTEHSMNRCSETSLLLQLVRTRVSKHATHVLNRPLLLKITLSNIAIRNFSIWCSPRLNCVCHWNANLAAANWLCATHLVPLWTHSLKTPDLDYSSAKSFLKHEWLSAVTLPFEHLRHLNDQNNNNKKTIKTVVMWNMKYYNIKYYFPFDCIFKVVCSNNGKAEFSASLLKSSVSHDPSEIILICWFDA